MVSSMRLVTWARARCMIFTSAGLSSTSRIECICTVSIGPPIRNPKARKPPLVRISTVLLRIFLPESGQGRAQGFTRRLSQQARDLVAQGEGKGGGKGWAVD